MFLIFTITLLLYSVIFLFVPVCLFIMAAGTVFNSTKYCGLLLQRELLKCSRYRAVSRNLLSNKHYENSSVQCRKNKFGVLNFSFLTCLGLGIGMGTYYYLNDKKKFFNQPVIFAAKPSGPLSGSGDEGGTLNQNFVADVVEKVAPTVVYIEIKDTRRYDFFTGSPATASNGSGFIVRQDGLILTNAHVVIGRPHNQVQVRLHDGSTYVGTVEHVDTKSDLATVRIPCKNLPVMKLGVSRNVRPGEFVVAIGSPLALSNTITFGVVSSVSRPSEELGLRGKHMDYIQTDASITFGNSGGPLVNLNGEAIGINSMKVTAGISFAIPIDYAKDFLVKCTQIKKDQGDQSIKKKIGFYLGVTMITLTPQILMELQAKNLSLPSDLAHGVLIWKVIVGSPAHSGGIMPGDIITHINKKAIHRTDDMYNALQAGTAISMTVVRGSNRFEVTVTPESS